MNILRVIASMNPSQGGPCQGIRNSIPELQTLNVYNEVVCLDSPEAGWLAEDKFCIHALGIGKGPWWYNSNLIPWLLTNLSRFDAVIVHGLWLYHVYAVRKAIRLLKKGQVGGSREHIPKVYLMPHGMLDPYFQKAKNRKIKAIRNKLYWSIIEGDNIKEADGLLFTCEAELQLAREPFRPYNPRREINVGYGIVEPARYNQVMEEAFYSKCPQVVKEPYLLFLSRIHEKKGVDILLKAYERVLETRTRLTLEESGNGEIPVDNPDYERFPKLVIAGPGLDTPYGQHIQRMVAQSPKLQASVFFPGMLTGDAKWGAFYGCEAFVLPSHQENFGIAVVEALACGRPVLISDQVNIWREINKGGGGMVYEDTVKRVYRMLLYWMQMHTIDKKIMGQKARVVFDKHFAIGPAANRLLEVLLLATI